MQHSISMAMQMLSFPGKKPKSSVIKLPATCRSDYELKEIILHKESVSNTRF